MFDKVLGPPGHLEVEVAQFEQLDFAGTSAVAGTIHFYHHMIHCKVRIFLRRGSNMRCGGGKKKKTAKQSKGKKKQNGQSLFSSKVHF